MADIEALELEITSDSNSATDALDRLTAALERLDKITGKATGITTANKKLTSLNKTLKNIASSAASVYVLKKVYDMIGTATKKSMAYVENMNLFTVSMGRFADEAVEYANVVSDVMGIDPSTWVRNQGIFMTLASGFGVVEERAYTMSKNLTQLGYDLSSFFNIEYADAMTKLQAGLSGELEPLRRLGYDLSKARLEAVALELGITKAYNAMTQAEKAQLRYYAIMTQVTQAQGDMARTLEQPANQIRVLQAQIEQCARAIGNIFIPALNSVLPYAIAVTKVIRELAEYVAGLAGFTLPEVEWDGGFSGIADSATEAEEATKKLKKSLLGFDELNVLQKDTETGAGAGGSEFSFELPEYDFLGDAVNTRVDEIVAQIERKLDEVVTGSKKIIPVGKEILDVVLAVSAGILAWKIKDTFTDSLGKVKSLISDIDKKSVGLTLGITGLALEFQGGYAMGQGDFSIGNIIKTAVGADLGIAGSLLMFGTGPLGWTIGILAALTVFITSFKLGQDKKISDMVKETFFESGNGITITDIAIRFENVAFEMTEGMDEIIAGHENIKVLQENVSNATESIDKMITAWGNGAISTEEATTQMKELITSLNTESKTILDEIYNNIVNALSGSFGNVLIEAGIAVPEIIGMLADIRDEGKTSIQSVTDEMMKLTQQFEENGFWTDEQSQRYANLVVKLDELVGSSSLVNDEFKDIRESIGNIDWESETSITDFFNNINSTIDTSSEKISTYWSDLGFELEQMRSTTQDPNYQIKLDELIAISDGAKQEDIDQLGKNLTELFDYMQKDILMKSADVVATANEEWDNMNWLERIFAGTSQENYLKSALEDYQNNIMTPITTEMEEAMNKLGIDGGTYGVDAMKDIMQSMFDYKNINSSTIGAYTVADFTGNMTNDLEKKLNNVGIDASVYAENAGLKIGESVADGVESGVSTGWRGVLTTLGDKVSSAIDWVKELLGIHSPSTVFIEIGEYTMEGLEIGISKQAVSAANTMRDSMNRVVNSASAQSGRIASRTAVTIERNESGSSYDDSAAMAEQNALLREQNRIMEQLLRKETVAVVSPSAGLGRVISQSQKMYTAMAGG